MNEKVMVSALGVIIATAAGIKMGGVPETSCDTVAEILLEAAQIIAEESGLDIDSVLQEGESTTQECFLAAIGEEDEE